MSDLGKKTKRAFIWDFSGTVLSGVFNFGISVVLARLLLPTEFGTVAIALAFVGLSNVFVEGGLSKALIQKKDFTDLHFSSVFYFNITVGFILTGLSFFLAPSISKLFQVEELELVMQIISPVFLLNSTQVIQTTWFQKQLNFKPLALWQLISALVGGGVGVVFAVNGFGASSLALQHLAAALVLSIALWSTSSFRPKRSFSLKSIRELNKVGGYILMNNIVSNLFTRLDVFIIGKLFQVELLGLYTRAISLRNVVTTYSSNTFQKVFFPVLSELQSEKERFNSVYLKVVSLIAIASFLISGCLFILSDVLIVSLYGSNWTGAIPYFQILILSACTFPLNLMVVNAFNSVGKSKENFWFGLIRKVLRLLSFLVLLLYGIEYFLWTSVFLRYSMTIFNVFLLGRYVRVPVADQLADLLIPAVPFIAFILYIKFAPQAFGIGDLPMAFLFVVSFLIWNMLFRTSGLQYFMELYNNRTRR